MEAEWSEHVDAESGKKYFVNSITNESTWEQPMFDAVNEVGVVIQEGAQKISDGAQQAANAAAPVIAEAGKKAGEVIQQAGNAAAPVIAEAGQKAGEVIQQAANAAAPIIAEAGKKAGKVTKQGAQKVSDGARQAVESTKQISNAAAPVIAHGAQKTAAGAKRAYKAASPHVSAAARRAGQLGSRGYQAAAPVVVSLAGQAGDVLANVPKPDIQFDTESARAALTGGVSMGIVAAASAATGCASFLADLLKVEIFRDFYQFLSIFFASLKMPEAFSVFFGTVSKFLALGFSSLLGYFNVVQAALNPVMWYFIFLAIAAICWLRLSCFMDTGKTMTLKLVSKDQRDKYDWKEINKHGMGKFKQVKYLLLALTTLYTPVTRNAIQMMFCAPKFAYSKWDCINNSTMKTEKKFYASPQEPDAPESCIVGYMKEASASQIKKNYNGFRALNQENCGIKKTPSTDMSGYQTSIIQTLAECTRAASSLNVPGGNSIDPIVDAGSDLSNQPPGCYWDGNLRWNPKNTSTTSCADNRVCLCASFDIEPDCSGASSLVESATTEGSCFLSDSLSPGESCTQGMKDGSCTPSTCSLTGGTLMPGMCTLHVNDGPLCSSITGSLLTQICSSSSEYTGALNSTAASIRCKYASSGCTVDDAPLCCRLAPSKCSTLTSNSVPTIAQVCTFGGVLKANPSSISCTSNPCAATATDKTLCCDSKTYTKYSTAAGVQNGCAGHSKVTITTQSECDAAAVDLNLSVQSSIKTSNSNSKPKGCYFDTSTNKLSFNPTSLDGSPCTASENCICGSSRRRSLRYNDEFSPSEYVHQSHRRLTAVKRGYVSLATAPSGNVYTPVAKTGYILKEISPPMYPVCFAGNHVGMVALSFLVLILFSLCFPCCMCKVVNGLKPTPVDPNDPENPVSHPPVPREGQNEEIFKKKKELYDRLHGKPVIFNDEGKLVEYTDKIFLLEVTKQIHSPFTTMYKGFERRWANYKVIVMALKGVQLCAMTLATSDLMARRVLNPRAGAIFASVAAIVTTGIFLVFSWSSNPYVDPVNDRMELTSKVTLIATPIFVLLGAATAVVELEVVIAVLLNIGAAAGNIFMIWLTVSTMQCCKTRIKKWNGTLVFSSPDGITLHENNDTLPDWNLDVERKRRIWKPFWDKVMNKDKELSGILEDKAEIKANHGQKYLKEEISHDGTKISFPLKRFEVQLNTLRVRGFEAFESGVLPLSRVEKSMRIQFQTMFEGPDVYCNDTWTVDQTSCVKDGHLDSANFFCRLEVDPYPYCLKLFWDGGGKDHAEIPSWGEHKSRLPDLWNMQRLPEVIRMKNIRLGIRGAACSPQLINFPYERDERCSRQVDDGQDSEGNRKTKTEHYTIHWSYTNGNVRVGSDFGNSMFEQGFKVSMSYTDGRGTETSGSQQGKTHSNGSTTIHESEMGINHLNYFLTPQLQHILTYGQNAQSVNQGTQIYMQQLKEFRIEQMKVRYWAQFSLSWSFWYLIYNNDLISMEQLRHHFDTVELNPKIKMTVVKYEKELLAITNMISYFNSNPCIAYWYVYWSDVFKMNSDLPGIKGNSDLFDPSVTSSICFTPMGRKATEEFLAKCEGGDQPLGKKQCEHLDRFFVKIDEISKKHPPTAAAVQSGVASGNTSGATVAPVSNPMNAAEIEMSEVKTVDDNVNGDDDGSAVWVGFAKSPVVSTASPDNITVIKDFSPGSAVWAEK